jgi:hypothetical protein
MAENENAKNLAPQYKRFETVNVSAVTAMPRLAVRVHGGMPGK